MGQTEAANQEELKWQIYDLSFSVHKSRRYHEKLCAFYSRWRDLMKVVTVFSGSGAFFLIFAGADKLAGTLSAFIALWAILDIVIGPDKLAEKHADLQKRFTALAKRIAVMPSTEEAYREMEAARLELEELEPPIKRLIDLEARNDECRARGFPPDDLVPLSRLQRRLGYFHTFGMPRLEEWKAKRHRASSPTEHSA